jgi:acid stress-induced BolA-like protein IbaG/YrbA
VATTPELIHGYIKNGLECTHLEVEGDGQHFTAVIVSPGLRRQAPIQRHQLVYAALGDRMREEIHALSMKTLTLKNTKDKHGQTPDRRRQAPER